MLGSSNHYDVLVVGGGPAGSTAARTLVAAGARVGVIDRAEFPRVKLCAGWLSPAIWDVLELSPRDYASSGAGLWEWHTAHVHYQGQDHAVPCHGWFIRRYELDDFLLRRSGAELHLGQNAKQLERVDDEWRIGNLRARFLVGAGGTHCPVARLLAPPRPKRAAGVQELEFQLDAAAIARTRLGNDGEPELVLFDDIGGYGWNVPKFEWLNVGCGTLDATAVRDQWTVTHDHLRAHGHLPIEAEPQLAHLKGHSYFLFAPVHLEAAYRDHAFLVGDSLGLAHPITAEGILPATVSGRHAAEAIVANAPASYPSRLHDDPVLADYRRVHQVMAVASKLKQHLPARRGPRRPTNAIARQVIARGFAWMFSGASLPAPRLLDRLLGTTATIRASE